MHTPGRTWQMIDAIEDMLYWRDVHGAHRRRLVGLLHKLYTLAWLEACRDRGREVLLARMSASLAWHSLADSVRPSLFTKVSKEVGD